MTNASSNVVGKIKTIFPRLLFNIQFNVNMAMFYEDDEVIGNVDVRVDVDVLDVVETVVDVNMLDDVDVLLMLMFSFWERRD